MEQEPPMPPSRPDAQTEPKAPPFEPEGGED